MLHRDGPAWRAAAPSSSSLATATIWHFDPVRFLLLSENSFAHGSHRTSLAAGRPLADKALLPGADGQLCSQFRAFAPAYILRLRRGRFARAPESRGRAKRLASALR